MRSSAGSRGSSQQNGVPVDSATIERRRRPGAGERRASCCTRAEVKRGGRIGLAAAAAPSRSSSWRALPASWVRAARAAPSAARASRARCGAAPAADSLSAAPPLGRSQLGPAAAARSCAGALAAHVTLAHGAATAQRAMWSSGSAGSISARNARRGPARSIRARSRDAAAAAARTARTRSSRLARIAARRHHAS